MLEYLGENTLNKRMKLNKAKCQQIEIVFLGVIYGKTNGMSGAVTAL